MFKYRQYCLTFLTIFFLVPWGSISAQELLGTEPVSYDVSGVVLEKINAFREEPLKAASLLGMSTEDAMKGKNPDMCRAICQGIGPLEANATLRKAMEEHLRWCLGQGHLSHIGRGGSLPDDRAAETGYPVILTGESMVMLAFENYVTPETAVDILLGYLFRDALTGSSPEASPLLFPGYTDLGAVLMGGPMNVGEKRINGYVLGLFFGASHRDSPMAVMGRVYDSSAASANGLVDARIVSLNLWGMGGEAWTWPDGSYYLDFDNTSAPLAVQADKQGWLSQTKTVQPEPEVTAYRLDFNLARREGDNDGN